jgi:hypothetical protein
VNALDERGRRLVIDRAYDKLVSDLKQLLATGWSEIRLVLIKKNVWKLLDPRLTDNGFKVLNKGRIVPFPSSGQQSVFDRRFREIVRFTDLATSRP